MSAPIRKRDWPVKRARARLLEVVDRAIADGPQSIWRNGKKAAIILSKEDFDRLAKRGLKTLSAH